MIGYQCNNCYDCLQCLFYIGCGQCWSIDGNWKLTFPHCMYPVETAIPGLPDINYPDVCRSQPITSKHAFCDMHHEIAIKNKVPIDIRGFIHYCGGKVMIGKLL